MAKVPFTKLQVITNLSEVKVTHLNKSGETICYDVKQYLPMKEKLDLITNIVNQSIDNNGFYNPMRVKVFMTLEIMYAYTNLTFTEKMKEDPLKLYDTLISSNIFNNVINAIGRDELLDVKNGVYDTIENIYKYRNSVMGILESVSADYSNLNLDASAIQQKLADGENIELLKDVLSKLG